MKITTLLKPLVALVIALLLNYLTFAQEAANPASSGELKKEIIRLDSLFFAAYNNCDLEKMKKFFTDDLEFYHDKAGLTSTSLALMESAKKGLCGNENQRLKRVAVDGTLQVFPLNNYGAILTGEHAFYIVKKGEKEVLDGLARFTHVWRFKDNEWRMHRVLSYDHKPAPANLFKESVRLSEKTLDALEGNYEGTQNKKIVVKKENGSISLHLGTSVFPLYAESETKFFQRDRNVSFEFVKGKGKKIEKMIVFENGAAVEEAKRIK